MPRQLLQQHNLIVLSVEPVKEVGALSRLSHLWEGVSAKEFVIFSRQLAVMIEAKVPLTAAFQSISRSDGKSVFCKHFISYIVGC